MLTSSEMITIEKSLRLSFLATNNEAEYEALLEGMAMVLKMGGKSIELFLDSRLVVGQVKGEFDYSVFEYMQIAYKHFKYHRHITILKP